MSDILSNSEVPELTDTEDREVLLSVKHLYKFFGGNKAHAQRMLLERSHKDEIQKKTGTTVAINDVSFEVKRGEIYVLIGLSGSGKSTVIRCLNGLTKPSTGSIFYEGKNIENYTIKQMQDFRRKKISMVFQNFGLMDHRNVLQNVVYGLEVQGVPKEEREKKAMEFIDMVGLCGWEQEKITSLSGGMRQRVGIARALANDPEVLLMDEPFSALDPLVRNDMQFELLSIQEKLNKTIIFITHDINEAFKLGNTVSIMKDGKIIQTDTPEAMAANPADDYVKDFIDSADKSQVFTADNIMAKPGCIIHSRDGGRNALKQMKAEGVSSAFVLGPKMQLVGLLTLKNAIKMKDGELKLEEAIERNIITTTTDTQISELLSVAAETQYPIAVVDNEKHLKGIITKAAVLASLA